MADPRPTEWETRVVSVGDKRGLDTDFLIGGAIALSHATGGFLNAAGRDAWDKLKDAVSGNDTPQHTSSSEEGGR